ncbi:ABC transporter permease subunit [Clostridium sp.]|uniref:ABC transporter permease n=1 Tax=Clostridium sp. TaxID=1506 RepID=UPI001DBBA739|nr:ABC transporter permease subunit [Clostridium sp.]MBS5940083.1 ABC transporter permease subunit [Clostridium sp.]
MLTLIKNELIKILKRPKTWIVFALFLAFIGITAYGTWSGDKNMREWISPEYQIKQAEEQLVYVRNDIKRAEADGDENWINGSKQIEQSLLKQIDDNKKIIENGIEEDAWKKQLDDKIKNLEVIIKEYEDTGINEWNKVYYAQDKQTLEDYKYLKANNIAPIENWEYNEYSFYNNLSQFFGLGLLIAGIAVFMSDIVSGECTPATLKFLLIQPVKRGKILFSKFIAAVITVLSLILIPQLAGMAIVNVTSNIEASDYPIRIEQQYEKKFDQSSQQMMMEQVPDTSTMVTNKEFALKSIGYQALFILTACSVVFMISTLFKSSMISMAISVILTIFLTIGAQAITTLSSYSHLLFTTYADSVSLLNSNLALAYNNPNLTTTTAIACMLITTIVAYIIAHFNFTKKDILI